MNDPTGRGWIWTLNAETMRWYSLTNNNMVKPIMLDAFLTDEGLYRLVCLLVLLSLTLLPCYRCPGLAPQQEDRALPHLLRRRQTDQPRDKPVSLLSQKLPRTCGAPKSASPPCPFTLVVGAARPKSASGLVSIIPEPVSHKGLGVSPG